MRNLILEQLEKVTESLQYFTGSTVITQADRTYTAATIGSGLSVGDTVVIAGAANTASNGTFVLSSVASGAIVVAGPAIGANETASITINQEWPGTFREIHGFAALVGAINCSGNAIIYIDQSGDGANVDYTSSWAVTGGTALSFTVAVILPYAKIRIRTNAADQTSMRAYLYGRKIS